MTLSGKKIVIVGGTSGIGRAVAEAAAAEGATTIVASSSAEKVAAAKDKGLDARLLNVRKEEDVAVFFDAIGTLDHLVHTAGDWGGIRGGALDKLDLDKARDVFAVRYWGAVTAAKHAYTRMPSGGSITFTDGMNAHRPRKGSSISAGMLGAIEHSVRGLAVDLAPVRVNCVCPGFILTEVWGNTAPEQRAKMTERFPLGRAGEPSEVAEAYLYLMKGGYTTGQVLYVDGGMGLV